MEIDKQAKILLMGEVVEIKNSYPVTITSMKAEMDDPISVQYATSARTLPGKITYRFEGETEMPFSMDYNKRYYLIEVQE